MTDTRCEAKKLDGERATDIAGRSSLLDMSERATKQNRHTLPAGVCVGRTSMEKAMPEDPARAKIIHNGGVYEGESVTESPTMEKTMPKSPMMEKTISQGPILMESSPMKKHVGQSHEGEQHDG